MLVVYSLSWALGQVLLVPSNYYIFDLGPPPIPWASGRRPACPTPCKPGRFFISIFFISVFYKNIFSIWKFTEIYPGRPAAGRQEIIRKKKTTRNCRQVPGDRSPGSRAAGLPGRPAAGRPAPLPLYKVLAAPPPSFALLKIQKKRKEREGEEG